MRTRSTRLGAFAVICDGDRLLLVHQVESGRWSLPGGGVHFSEPPGEALIREVDEEVGLQVIRAELLGVHDNVYDPGDGVQRHGVRLLYRAHAEGVPTPRSPHEVDEVRFFSADDLPVPLTEWAARAAHLIGTGPRISPVSRPESFGLDRDVAAQTDLPGTTSLTPSAPGVVLLDGNMSELRLTAYQQEDQEGFARLVKDVHSEFSFSYHAELDADLDDPESHYPFILLVKCGTTVVGSAALTEPRAGSTTLKRMYLRPSLRGLGWGRRLLDGVTERAVEYGCEQIRLDTTTRQAGARRLYERNGFKLVSQDGDTLFYSKDL